MSPRTAPGATPAEDAVARHDDAGRAALERRIAELPPEKRDLLIRQLGRRNSAAGAGTGALPRAETHPESRHEPYALSEIQKVYWIGRSGLYDLGGGGTNAYLELELGGFEAARVPRLAHAFRRLVERHDGLRTVFHDDGTQRVVPHPVPWRFPVCDLRRLAPPAVERALERVRRRLRHDPVPLDRAPLFDFQGHLLAGGRLRLTLRVETSLVDGGSRDVFFGDLFRFYAEPHLTLPPPDLTYRDYVVAWEGFRGSAAFRAARRHWIERLDALPPPPAVPLAAPLLPSTPGRLVNREGRSLESEAWRRLRERAAEHALTPSAALAAAFAATLVAARAGDAFTLSMVGTERPPIHPRIDRVLGNFNRLTLLPVTTTGGGFAERARQLQDELRRGLDHAHFTGSEVLRELGRRRPGRRPPAPVAFNSLVEAHAAPPSGGSAAPPPRPELSLRLVDAGVYVPQLLLLMTVDEMDGALHHRTQAAEDVLAEGWAEGIWSAYGDLLRRLAGDAGTWREPFSTVAAAAQAAAAHQRAAEVLAGWPAERPAAADAPGPPPRDDLETWLAGLWSELLDRAPAGVDEDFFALGGDSFRLAHLAARVRPAAPGVELWHFFDRPTVAGLADLLRRGGAGTGGRP